MGVVEILQHIDREIAQLEQARALLTGDTGKTARASNNAVAKKGKKKRMLTPEGRKRIVEAVRRRWAKQRKAVSGK